MSSGRAKSAKEPLSQSEQDLAAEKQVEMWKVKKLIKSLTLARG
jgi:hypothetical protein